MRLFRLEHQTVDGVVHVRLASDGDAMTRAVRRLQAEGHVLSVSSVDVPDTRMALIEWLEADIRHDNF